MIAAAFRMRFLGPLHVDAKGTGFYNQAEPSIRSDTLSAALTQAAYEIGVAGTNDWAVAPPWRVSSTFPVFGPYCFLPRPVSDRIVNLGDQLESAKRIKKIRWLEVGLWREVTAGRWDWKAANNWDDLPGGMALRRENAERLPQGQHPWAEEERPRLAIDRVTNSQAEGQLFNFSRIHYPDEGGLWFVAQVEDKAAVNELCAVLEWLGDQGIGADRTNGNGHFQVVPIDPVPVPLSEEREAGVTLSLVNPAEGELDAGLLDTAAYDLVKRGGWIGHTGRRKASLRMFGEGSFFSRALRGRIVKVADHPLGHPVYRDGRGVFAVIGGER